MSRPDEQARRRLTAPRQIWRGAAVWFYPAFMLVVGAHYLSFVFLHGMRHYIFLGAALIGSGLALGILFPSIFAAGGWLTGLALVVFGLFVWQSGVGKDERQAV